MNSLWTKTATMPRFRPLKQDCKTDVLIIGGGMAGLLCAHALAQRGVDYILVEAETICGGITQNTTAKITSQHGLIYSALCRRYGLEAARLHLQANQRALQEYQTLCRDIDCDFQEQDAYVYALNGVSKLKEELEVLWQLDFPAQLTHALPLPFPVAGAIRFPRQAQFHPLKFAAAITQNLHLYEHTPVRELAPNTARTDHACITANQIIVATHFPILNKHGGFFLKLYQHRSYVLALEQASSLSGMYVDEAEDGMSFRSAQDLLLVGGGGHRTGRQVGGWDALEQFTRRRYPNAKIHSRWATQDCITLDRLPYIGPYSSGTQGLYVATGFNKWGMTSSMVAAGVLADLVCGKESPYAGLYSPSRTMLHPQLAANALEAAANLLTPTAPRCPHMGCALKWNQQERSWDCPCHGSRFTQSGRLLDNPATDGLPHWKHH